MLAQIKYEKLSYFHKCGKTVEIEPLLRSMVQSLLFEAEAAGRRSIDHVRYRRHRTLRNVLYSLCRVNGESALSPKVRKAARENSTRSEREPHRSCTGFPQPIFLPALADDAHAGNGLFSVATATLANPGSLVNAEGIASKEQPGRLQRR